MATKDSSSGSLYISDLDGTLLGADGFLSAYSTETLNSLLKRGLQFTVASARSVSSIRNALSGLDLRLPVIEFNGAVVSDLRTGKHFFVDSIESSIAGKAISLIEEFGSSPFVSAFTAAEDRLYYSSVKGDGMQWYLNNPRFKRDRRLKQLANITESLCDQVICINVTGRKEALTALVARLEELYGSFLQIHCLQDHYSPGFCWLTAHSKTASKGNAVKFLQEFTGTSRMELVVFGDNSNDADMFKIADRAVAVSNAVPELKAHADEIIGRNENDSVVLYLQKEKKNNTLCR